MSDLYRLEERILTAIIDLENACHDEADAGEVWAERERIYRKAKAEAFLRSEGRNAEERAANAEEVRFGDETLSDVRYRRDLAAGLRDSSKGARFARSAILSALQTLAGLSRAEAELVRTAPR